jgi:G:T/U-mismatch repair DNA glycosylase
VIDYYTEKWRHCPKEYKLSLKKKSVSDSDKVMTVIRKTKTQAIRFLNKNSKKICFNKRKLNELPNFILKLDDIEKILFCLITISCQRKLN